MIPGQFIAAQYVAHVIRRSLFIGLVVGLGALIVACCGADVGELLPMGGLQ